MQLKAIGIVRVSQPKGRSGPSFSSPGDQRRDIEKFCVEKQWRLVATHDELHVSGNALLEDRPGLSQAVTAVLTGAADVIVGAHSERLWWSHEVRAQVLRVVQDAGGEVWAVDSGQLSNGSAASDFSGEVRTSADRFSRRQNAEKSRDAVQNAIDRGVAPWPNVPPGYVKGDDDVYMPSPDSSVILEAFELRAERTTIEAIRTFLRARGIVRSYHGVGALLKNRAYLGEIHFGSYTPNLSAHDAIVPRAPFQRVQRVSITRGRKAKSERLLARLGVLRCATCDSRMVVGTQTQNGRSYPFYRCGHVREDCERRVTISADLAELAVVDAVKRALADVEGRASVESNAREAELAVERTQAALEAAIRSLTGLEDEPATVERLGELRAGRDRAVERVDHLGGHRAVVTVNAADDWDRLSLDARRALIRATVERASVSPGRGADRVTVELVGQ